MAVHMGYMGTASIGAEVFLTGSSFAPIQQVFAPDVVQQTNFKRVWCWGKVESGGNVSGYISQGMDNLWSDAFSRTDDDPGPQKTVDIEFVAGGGYSMTAYLNSVEASASAGEAAQFSADLFSGEMTVKKKEGSSRSKVAPRADCMALVLWSECNASCGVGGDYQAFTASVNNNLERIYALNQGSTLPFTILGGWKEVSGSASIYADGNPDAGTSGDTSGSGSQSAAMTFSFGPMSGGCQVAVQHGVGSATTGPGIYNYNFTGVGC